MYVYNVVSVIIKIVNFLIFSSFCRFLSRVVLIDR